MLQELFSIRLLAASFEKSYRRETIQLFSVSKVVLLFW
jgi:hypothetical protein